MWLETERHKTARKVKVDEIYTGTEEASGIIVSLAGKTAAATGEFGNCGDAPTGVYSKQLLTITFPAGSRRDTYIKGAKQIWQYANGN